MLLLSWFNRGLWQFCFHDAASTEMLRKDPYLKYAKNERTEVHTIDVHVLDESWGGWVKKYTTQPIITDGLRLPRCLTTGEVVVELWEGDDSHNRGMFFYDPNTKRLSTKFDAFVPVWDHSYTHVKSLVCLEGMEPIETEVKEITWYIQSMTYTFIMFFFFVLVLGFMILCFFILKTNFLKYFIFLFIINFMWL